MVIKSKPILVRFLIAFKFSTTLLGFSGGSDGKESASNVGDLDSVPGLGRSAGEGIGYPLWYSWASLVAQLVKNPPTMQEAWVQSLGLEDFPGEGKGYTL